MDRQTILSLLIRFDAPVADLKAALATLSWDSGPVITLTRQNIAAVLQRFASREIDAASMEEWANLVECREDICFESCHEEVVANTIHALANPELTGRLTAATPDLMSGLRL
jgi:hypothetical protein